MEAAQYFHNQVNAIYRSHQSSRASNSMSAESSPDKSWLDKYRCVLTVYRILIIRLLRLCLVRDIYVMALIQSPLCTDGGNAGLLLLTYFLGTTFIRERLL